MRRTSSAAAHLNDYLPLRRERRSCMRTRSFGLTIAGMVGGVAALGWVVAIWTSN